MKNLIDSTRVATLIFLLFIPFVGSAQTSNLFIWPIKGEKAGNNILLRPQDSLGSEVSYETLIIGAEEGKEVIAPADCEIISFGIEYFFGLFEVTSYQYDGENTFDGMRKKMEADPKVSNPKKFINGHLWLKLSDGNKISIDGLRGNIPFRTGQRIKAGTVIGTVGYVFSKIGQPHISISMSSKAGHNIDPMTPFGLQTTFKKAEPFTPPAKLTRKQANEDFDVFIQTIRECYPSLRDIISPEREAEFIREGKARLDSNEVHFTTLYNLIGDAFRADFLHDSHAWLQSSNPFVKTNADSNYPSLMLCTLGDRMFVRLAQPGYEQYVGKEIATINGVSAKEHAAYVRSRTTLFDAQVESSRAIQMLTNWWLQYRDWDHPMNLTFTDGTSVEAPFLKRNQLKGYAPQPTAPIAYNAHKNQNRHEDWSFKMLTDDIALLTLAHFHLNDVQMETIADSLRTHAHIPHLIVDVRDNPGGDAGCEEKLVRLFLKEEPLNLGYQKVMSNTTYASFAHSYNWPPDAKPFEEFVAVEGMEGFYNRDITQKDVQEFQTQMEERQDSVIYSGKLYILTNENSFSAATDFPARLVRANRAVTIGRETGTAYHYMTALKFARLFLPNSRIEYQLPLVKLVATTDVTPRFPYGRGLLPDYEVPLTREEFFSSTEDVILARALEIIKEGKRK